MPVNISKDEVPMEFDMTLAVPRGRPDIKSAIEQALEQHKDDVQRILVDFGVPLVCALREAECAALLRELERMRWNISRTAQALGISRNTLYRKIHKHRIVLEH